VKDLRPSGWNDLPGQVLLQDSSDDRATKNPGHSVINIQRVLEGLGPPPVFEPSTFRAFDVFTGYLTLDALIANSDRHDRNWAVLRPQPGEPGPDLLCGSYDHASSLAFNLSDDQRARRLREGTVRSWAERGRARQFERLPGQSIPTLVELAHSALRRCSSEARDRWQEAVRSFDATVAERTLTAMPGLSVATATFSHEVLMINRKRLLDVC